MAFMSTISIIGSGITAQHLRLDVISENVTNMNTTRTEEGGAYRRKLTVFQAVDGRDTFRNVLALTQNGMVSNVRHENTGGVKVVEIAEDPSDFKLKYDPTDPDANEEGYVELRNGRQSGVLRQRDGLQCTQERDLLGPGDRKIKRERIGSGRLKQMLIRWPCLRVKAAPAAAGCGFT